MVFEVLPEYLQKLLQLHIKTHTARSNYISLNIPRKKTTYGHYAFEFAAPNDWNVLQKGRQEAQSLPG